MNKFSWKFKPDPNKPNYIRAEIETFDHEDNKPFGMRLENGNFIRASADQVEKID